MAEQAPVRFRFGPLERRGVVLGLRAEQLAVVGGSLVVLVALLAIAGSLKALLVGLTLVVLAAVAAFYPISSGRTLDQWAPVGARFIAHRLLGRHRHISLAPLAGHVTRGPAPSVPLPAPLAGLEILEVPTEGGVIGVVHDRQASTYVGYLLGEGKGYALVSASDKASRLSRFGTILAGLAKERSRVAAIQFLAHSVPDEGGAMERRLSERGVLPDDSPAAQSYRRLIADAAPTTHTQETVVAVAVHSARAGKAIRKAGGGDQGACTVVVRQLIALRRQLEPELAEVRSLTPRQVAQLFRTSFDPASRRHLIERGARHPAMAGCSPSSAWPIATECQWSRYHTDSAWHATFWAAELPSLEVGTEWLMPLMSDCRHRQTVSWTGVPVGAARSQRDIEAASIADIADASMRQRGGFRLSLRRRKEAENVERREQEIVEGYADYRFSVYVTVSAGSPEDLEDACEDLQERANDCGIIEVRRLDGEQDRAFTYTLPLGRGVR